MARPNLLREIGIQQDAEIHDRALGEVGGVMDVCPECGRIIRSTVVDVDGHAADCAVLEAEAAEAGRPSYQVTK